MENTALTMGIIGVLLFQEGLKQGKVPENPEPLLPGEVERRIEEMRKQIPALGANPVEAARYEAWANDPDRGLITFDDDPPDPEPDDDDDTLIHLFRD